MNITDYIEQQRQKINRAIEDHVVDAINPLYRHHQAAVYTIFPEGHRYRAMLALELYTLLGGLEKKFIKGVVGVECIHHASLIFDDLPCMDNARIRKGKQTTWLEYGEATAILAAEYLESLGRYLVHKNAAEHSDAVVRLVEQHLHNTVRTLLTGQEVDLQSNKLDEDMREAMRNKNSLFYLACVLPGAILQHSEYLTILDALGSDISIAYQLFDDLRDISDSKITGKAVGIDRAKETSVYRWGEEAVRRMLEERKERIIAHIRQIQPDSYLEQTINYILTTPS